MRRVVQLFLTVGLAIGLGVGGLALAPSAGAHEERPAEFPDGTGAVPHFLGYDNARARVVCKKSSRARIAAMPAGRLKRVNTRLLRRCDFHSIQDAVNTIRHRRTSIYVLPGRYTESKWAKAGRSDYCSHLATESDDPLGATAQYIGSLSGDAVAPEADGLAAEAEETSDPIALSYADQRRCAHNLNLIALFGDATPHDDSIACDSRFCGTQIVGTGRHQGDVLIDNQFSKLNAIRLDRMGGVYLANMTFQQAEFNSVYVLETDGFVLDRLVTRANDEYGILAFASDHGLIERTNNYYNGDSGIYPGSGSDLNADNPEFEVTRYAIEIRNNRSHHNTLGYSGTAGNSIWAHHNRFYDNATGIATDSLFPGHPGLPQDHARWSNNRIYSNNTNFYTEYVDNDVCDRPMPERGYMEGAVCPVVPTPVGTGVLIAGGNFNSTDHNWIYDNWRNGTMQFWVPAPLRDEMDPQKLYDTSHDNRTFANTMGISPAGAVRPNGLDHWWDDEGHGNCWEDNTSSYGEATNNFTLPVAGCDQGGSVFEPGLAVKDAGFLSCSQYDRSDPTLRHPPGCGWFDSPSQPSADGASATGAGAVADDSDVQQSAVVATEDLADEGPLGLLVLTAFLAAGGAIVLRRRA
ncbi:right-handed parallel beta-helix repeat-containing protein [Nocardioides acrostichi]|uniref:Right-handed parallel beta-helix repeat-containing protein n=1 Tax=Nocardioides acrostichi TaxID=2784339 RepID=A0A930UWW3_9ACTN|nr:right-handed parallel beta-helix repeat-containing protein [Nocardioides acrostichi]MBF4161621.1 right-handed parallel beta-helix repeat-containing protein [Nocardioides acrostichi]